MVEEVEIRENLTQEMTYYAGRVVSFCVTWFVLYRSGLILPQLNYRPVRSDPLDREVIARFQCNVALLSLLIYVYYCFRKPAWRLVTRHYRILIVLSRSAFPHFLTDRKAALQNFLDGPDQRAARIVEFDVSEVEPNHDLAYLVHCLVIVGLQIHLWAGSELKPRNRGQEPIFWSKLHTSWYGPALAFSLLKLAAMLIDAFWPAYPLPTRTFKTDAVGVDCRQEMLGQGDAELVEPQPQEDEAEALLDHQHEDQDHRPHDVSQELGEELVSTPPAVAEMGFKFLWSRSRMVPSREAIEVITID